MPKQKSPLQLTKEELLIRLEKAEETLRAIRSGELDPHDALSEDKTQPGAAGSVILDRKQTDDRLAYLASFPEKNPNPVIEVDFEGRVRYVNPAAQRIFPDLQEQGPAHAWLVDWDLITQPFHTGQTDRIIQDVAIGDRIYQQSLYLLAPDQIVRVYWLDITERKRAELAQQASEERMRVTLTSIGDGVISADDQGRITFLNPVAAALTGWELGEVLGLPISSVFKIIDEKTRQLAEEIVMRAMRERHAILLANNTALITRDGREIPIEDSAAPILDVDGNVMGVVLVFHDVTEKRRAQTELRESEERLQFVLENCNIGAWDMYILENTIIRSPEHDRIFGYPDLLPHWTYEMWLKHVLPEDRARVDAAFQLALQTQSGWSFEFRIRRPDGQVRSIWATGRQRRDPDGIVRGVAGIVQDITERKQTEERLAYLASFPEKNPNPIVEVDFEGRVRYANPAALGTFPDLQEQGSAHPWIVDWDAIIHRFHEGQTSIITRDVIVGDRICLQSLHHLAPDPLVRVYGVDITERRQAEAALQASQERLRVTLNSIGDGVIATDAGGLVTFLNPIAAALTGWKLFEAFGQDFSSVFKIINEKTRQPAEDIVRRALVEGTAVRLANNTALISRDGREIPIEDSAAPILDADGKVAGVVLVFHDVTEKRRAQAALRESERRLSKAQEIAHLGSWELDLVSNQLSWSDEVYRIFGLQPQEFGATYEAFLEAIHPDDRAAVDAAYSGSLRAGRDTYEIEHRVVKRSSGEIHFVHEKCEHFRDEGGQIIRSVGMVHDITERRQAEDELRVANLELTRFNQAMVGRELRMIELKKEVNELCINSSEPPRYRLDFDEEGL